MVYNRQHTTLEVGDGYELEACSNCNSTGRVAPALGDDLVTCTECQGARMVPVKLQPTHRGPQ